MALALVAETCDITSPAFAIIKLDPMALETESTFYETISSQLLEHNKGKFALVVGNELLGIFDRPDTAYARGIELRGNVPMLIKPITDEQKIESIPAMVLGLINAHVQ